MPIMLFADFRWQRVLFLGSAVDQLYYEAERCLCGNLLNSAFWWMGNTWNHDTLLQSKDYLLQVLINLWVPAVTLSR